MQNKVRKTPNFIGFPCTKESDNIPQHDTTYLELTRCITAKTTNLTPPQSLNAWFL